MKAQTQKSHQIALSVALISWGMLFATLFLGYAVYRFQMPQWPTAGVRTAPLQWPIISTILVVLSSVSCHLALVHYRTLRSAPFRVYTWISWCLGLAFFVSQFLFWENLSQVGLYTQSGIYASLLHGMTWIHAAHMALAMIGLTTILFLAYRESSMGSRQTLVSHLTTFWHFLGIIWILMFIVLFIL